MKCEESYVGICADVGEESGTYYVATEKGNRKQEEGSQSGLNKSLLYDPQLKWYFDPATGEYYEKKAEL